MEYIVSIIQDAIIVFINFLAIIIVIMMILYLELYPVPKNYKESQAFFKNQKYFTLTQKKLKLFNLLLKNTNKLHESHIPN